MKKTSTLLLLIIFILTLSACSENKTYVDFTEKSTESDDSSIISKDSEIYEEIQDETDESNVTEENSSDEAIVDETHDDSINTNTEADSDNKSDLLSSDSTSGKDIKEIGKEITDKLINFELVVFSLPSSFDSKAKAVLVASVCTEKTELENNDCIKIYPEYEEAFDQIYLLSEDDITNTAKDYLGEDAKLSFENKFGTGGMANAVKSDENYYLYLYAGETECDYNEISSSVDETETGFIYTKEIFYEYWGNDHSIPTDRITYTFEKNNDSSFGYIITDVNVTILNSENKSSNNSFSINEPFYGVWISAYTNEDEANEMAYNTPDGIVILSTDWENLNSKPYYCVTSGIYATEAEAQAACDELKGMYPSAYVKYSGNQK